MIRASARSGSDAGLSVALEVEHRRQPRGTRVTGMGGEHPAEGAVADEPRDVQFLEHVGELGLSDAIARSRTTRAGEVTGMPASRRVSRRGSSRTRWSSTPGLTPGFRPAMTMSTTAGAGNAGGTGPPRPGGRRTRPPRS